MTAADEADVLRVAIGVLRDLADGRCSRDEAVRRLRDAAADADLVWQRETYDGSVHYDVLVPVDGGTLSVSYCPDRGLPWPMRGVHRWSEADLLRVDGRVITVAEAMTLVDAVWQEQPLLSRLVDYGVVQAELERDPPPVDDEALQRGVDEFRRVRGLHSVDATREWLADRGLSHADVERVVADQLMLAALRERVEARAAGDREAFDRWISDRRRAARVEWFWGESEKPPPRT